MKLNKKSSGLFAVIIGAGSLIGVTFGQNAAMFKLAGIETHCVVDRLVSSGRQGGTNVGVSGGAVLTDEEARAAYGCAKSQMAAAYAGSGNTMAKDFIQWANFSTTPYTSATHGNRYVNNYANNIAAQNYSQYEEAGKFPVGSILAKDSFVVNGRGRVVYGALSLMEKMPSGFNPEFNDWRYTMILPDGMLVGTTGGMGSENVKFCAGCHAAVDSQDNVFFVPEQYRARGGWQRK